MFNDLLIFDRKGLLILFILIMLLSTTVKQSHKNIIMVPFGLREKLPKYGEIWSMHICTNLT